VGETRLSILIGIGLSLASCAPAPSFQPAPNPFPTRSIRTYTPAPSATPASTATIHPIIRNETHHTRVYYYKPIKQESISIRWG
jgi:hypothetical protein